MSISYYEYMSAAKVNFKEGRYIASWHNLFELEFYRDESREKPLPSRTPTKRQEEVKKLWQERGQIEFAISNVAATVKALQRYGIHTSANYLNKMSWELVQARTFNQQQFATVKQRIPDELNRT